MKNSFIIFLILFAFILTISYKAIAISSNCKLPEVFDENLSFAIKPYSDEAENNFKNMPVDSLVMEATFVKSLLHVKAIYYYIHKNKPIDSLYFVLNPNFKIESIQTTGLVEYNFVPKNNRPFPFLLLKLNHELITNSITKISFDYQIDLEKTTYLGSNWIELMVDQFWFPNAQDADNKFSSRLIVKNLYPDYTLFSYHSFKKLAEQTYEITPKEPSPEISFLAGKNMKIVNKKEGKMSLGYFVRDDIEDSLLDNIHKKFYQTTDFYNQSFGKVKPVFEASVALRRISRKVNNSQTSRQYMIITGEDFNDYGNFAHELGHFWWTGANFINEPWLNESFANLSALYVMKKYDFQRYERNFALYKKKAEKKGAVATAGVFENDTYDLYYNKGTYLLTLLEQKIGEKKMMELLEKRIEANINDTNNFLNLIEITAGKENRLYFENLISE